MSLLEDQLKEQPGSEKKPGLAPSAIDLGQVTSQAVVIAREALGERKYLSIGDMAALGIEKIPDEELETSLKWYEAYHDEHDEAVKVGLFENDLKAAILNPETVLMQTTDQAGQRVFAPLLVPSESLEWYNHDLLKEIYGEDGRFFYFAHPPLPETAEEREQIQAVIKERLDAGDIIFFDQYEHDDGASPFDIDGFALSDEDYRVENLGRGEQRKGEVFAGVVNLNGLENIKINKTLYETYQELVQRGEIPYDPENGISAEDVIEGAEAEEIWKIYESPFEHLGEDHPSHAGFDKETLLEVLRDPKIAKFVNKVDGEITTLCLFVNDFDKCPWFNKRFYEQQFGEFVENDNVFMFPGIVSDENRKGSSYSLKLIKFATDIMTKRGSNILVTFECTEISATYIPRIVSSAIHKTGLGEVDGLDKPISLMDYKAVIKAK